MNTVPRQNRSEREHSDWHVIVPVYNEADHLGEILSTIMPLGYADRITFVNDASTDGSGDILDSWAVRLRCRVLHLAQNRRKEGAIREVLERLAADGRLPDWTILLDADSFMTPNGKRTVPELVAEAISHMNAHGVAGMAFRIDAIVPPGIVPLEWCIYADYSGSQFDNWLTSRGGYLWVINGPGGIFDSSLLLGALRDMVPDFETGDLMITVLLMKNGHRVEFWPMLTVRTWVPSTYREYFQQRRRWERGTLRVMWRERAFYWSLFREFRLLSLFASLYLVFPLGVVTLPAVLCIVDAPLAFVGTTLLWNYVLWVTLTAAKCSWNRWSRGEGMMLRSVLWSILNGSLFIVATGPARFIGLTDAVRSMGVRKVGAS